ncbi:glycoside hydrolase family 28 protein [Chengkuizengella sp. SCS-71B]|uniref:glycoside hydrolase family 28 protein n=1 Tax=Chengkuizengella sp. SCS-71B TaxID=3115290 RepID=UPI0032C23C17
MSFFNIIDYGAKGDRASDNTEAIAAALEDCSSMGGGTVYIPAGTFLTGPITLRSHITLFIEAGAKLLFKDDFNQYPPVKTRWSGYECYGYHPLIYGYGLTNVTIKGGGIIDGQGEAWWKVNRKLRKKEKYVSERTKEIAELNRSLTDSVHNNIVEWESQFFRPPLLQLMHCEQVTLEGVTLQNSPFWNTHLVYCDNVNVHGVNFKNPSNTPNGDGFDIDSCSNVRVSDCHFDVGDDCLCLKSGINEDGRRVGRPTENITITNCTMLHGHGGVVFGSENSGGIQNVTVSNCVFIGTDRGIRIKTNRARGSYIQNILVNNIYMEDVFCPFAINSFYRHGVDDRDPNMNNPNAIEVTEKTPRIKHIQVKNVTAKKCRAAAGFIYGLPEMPVEEVTLSHVNIEMTKDPNEVGGEPDMVKEKKVMAGAGIYGKHIQDLVLDHVRVETRQGEALVLEQSSQIELNHFSMKNKHDQTSVVSLNHVHDIYIDGKDALCAEKADYLQYDANTCKQLIYCGEKL